MSSIISLAVCAMVTESHGNHQVLNDEPSEDEHQDVGDDLTEYLGDDEVTVRVRLAMAEVQQTYPF